jgi:hypothetical protein
MKLIIYLSDKPLPPQGPLDVSDITPETCSLSWKPPTDDGGSPITNYVVEKLDPFSGVSFLLFCLKFIYCSRKFWEELIVILSFHCNLNI